MKLNELIYGINLSIDQTFDFELVNVLALRKFYTLETKL